MLNADQRISCIGPGKVGQNLMQLFAACGKVTIGAVIGRTLAQASAAQKMIKYGVAADDFSVLRRDDIVLIAVKDRQIEEIAAQLASCKFVDQDTIVFHCSGSLSSDVLTRAGFRRAASVHPLFSFPSAQMGPPQFAGTSCSYEGDAVATALLLELFTAIGAKLFEIKAADKILYHAACVFASNYCVAMCALASDLFSRLSIDRELALAISTDLARSAIENVRNFGFQKGLTGPARRGDNDVIEAHISALNCVDPSLGQLYTVLSQRLVELCRS